MYNPKLVDKYIERTINKS